MRRTPGRGYLLLHDEAMQLRGANFSDRVSVGTDCGIGGGRISDFLHTTNPDLKTKSPLVGPLTALKRESPPLTVVETRGAVKCDLVAMTNSIWSSLPGWWQKTRVDSELSSFEFL